MNTIPKASVRSLILACFTSTLLAAVVLIIAVLPAEYNIDPTGLGKTLGLTVLSQTAEASIRQQLLTVPRVAIHV